MLTRLPISLVVTDEGMDILPELVTPKLFRRAKSMPTTVESSFRLMLLGNSFVPDSPRIPKKAA